MNYCNGDTGLLLFLGCKENGPCVPSEVYVEFFLKVYCKFTYTCSHYTLKKHHRQSTSTQRPLYMKESVNTFCCCWNFLVQKLFCILVDLKSTPVEVVLEINNEVSTMEACIVHSFHAHKQVSFQI